MAGVGAAVVNAVIYLLAAAVGVGWAEAVVPGRGQITLGAVVFSSLVPALVGAAVFALLARFTRRPVRNFRVLAAVVLVLSFVTPFSVPGAPAAVIVVLILMHVAAAVVITGVLTTLARGGDGA